MCSSGGGSGFSLPYKGTTNEARLKELDAMQADYQAKSDAWLKTNTPRPASGEDGAISNPFQIYLSQIEKDRPLLQKAFDTERQGAQKPRAPLAGATTRSGGRQDSSAAGVGGAGSTLLTNPEAAAAAGLKLGKHNLLGL